MATPPPLTLIDVSFVCGRQHHQPPPPLVMPLLRLLYGWLLCCLLSCRHLLSTGPSASCQPSLSSTPFLLWWSSPRLPPQHRHHVPLDKCWEKRHACGGGLSTRPPPSFSSLSLAMFDCCCCCCCCRPSSIIWLSSPPPLRRSHLRRHPPTDDIDFHRFLPPFVWLIVVLVLG